MYSQIDVFECIFLFICWLCRERLHQPRRLERHGPSPSDFWHLLSFSNIFLKILFSTFLKSGNLHTHGLRRISLNQKTFSESNYKTTFLKEILKYSCNGREFTISPFFEYLISFPCRHFMIVRNNIPSQMRARKNII